MPDPQLIRAEYLIADPDRLGGGVIEDGACVIEDGRVVAVGPWRELEPRYRGLTPLGDGRDRLAIPGLINAHHHGRGLGTLQTGMVDAPLELWLPSFLLYPQVDPYWDTLYAAARMLRSGITTSLQSHSSGGPMSAFETSVRRALDAYRDAGVRVAFAIGHYDQKILSYLEDEQFLAHLPPALRREAERHFALDQLYIDTDDYFAFTGALESERATSYPKAKLLLSPIGLHWASDRLLERTAAAAEHYRMGVHLHLVETKLQRRYVARRFGEEPMQVLDDFGLSGPQVSVAHAIWSSERDIELYAETGTTVVTNTSSNLRLGSGKIPLPEMLDRGVEIAIGTDSMGLFGEDDLLQEMGLLAALHRGPDRERLWPSPFDTLRMATTGGARAAQLEGVVGRLLPGYRADVTVIDLRRLRTPYLHARADLVALALAQSRASDVDTVLVEGRVLVQSGRLTRLDPRQISLELQQSCREAEKGEDEARAAFLDRLTPWLHNLYHDWFPGDPDEPTPPHTPR